tara:strand:- start:164 stop:589 length:426 start_codon:yes stop_codon:yes gene_type:complete
MSFLLSIDPGKSKCGIVLVDSLKEEVIDGQVIPSEALLNSIRLFDNDFDIEKIFLGNGTSSSKIKEILIDFADVQLIDEYGTTLKARKRYWELWPPKNWRKLIPRDLLMPPQELDAVAALVLLENHLQKQLKWDKQPSFKI